jgi:hypothetical protein
LFTLSLQSPLGKVALPQYNVSQRTSRTHQTDRELSLSSMQHALWPMLREWMWGRETKERKHSYCRFCSPRPHTILSTPVDVTRWHLENDETTRRL